MRKTYYHPKEFPEDVRRITESLSSISDLLVDVGVPDIGMVPDSLLDYDEIYRKDGELLIRGFVKSSGDGKERFYRISFYGSKDALEKAATTLIPVNARGIDGYWVIPDKKAKEKDRQKRNSRRKEGGNGRRQNYRR